MRRATVFPLLALLAGACSKAGPSPTRAGDAIVAEVASVDLYAGSPQRVLVGMFANDGRLVSFGSVHVSFAYTGTVDEPVDPQPGPEGDATYVPTPGTPAGEGEPVTLTQPSEARGLYQTTVEFDRAGVWEATVDADVEGVGRISLEAAVLVADAPLLPGPGERALHTENLTLDSPGAPPGAIDSLAVAGGPIPDPELHRWTIAGALDRGMPILVAFATPAFCTSRFCGPVVSAVQDLERRFRGRAAFIHVEIWRNYEKRVINRAAADWLLTPDGDLTEPWLYLVDRNGVIVDRWSSVFDSSEVATELEPLLRPTD